MADYYEVINLGYPNNVLAMLGIHNPTEDQIKGYEVAFNSLSPRNREYVLYRFSNCRTLQECGEHFGVSRQCIDDGIKRSIKKMKSEKYWPYIQHGYHNYRSLEEARKAKEFYIAEVTERDKGRKRLNRRLESYEGHDLRLELNRDVKMHGYYLRTKKVHNKFSNMFLNDYNPPPRVKRFFKYLIGGNPTFSDILNLIITNPKWYNERLNFGKSSTNWVYDLLYSQEALTKTEYAYLKALS